MRHAFFCSCGCFRISGGVFRCIRFARSEIDAERKIVFGFPYREPIPLLAHARDFSGGYSARQISAQILHNFDFFFLCRIDIVFGFSLLVCNLWPEGFCDDRTVGRHGLYGRLAFYRFGQYSRFFERIGFLGKQQSLPAMEIHSKGLELAPVFHSHKDRASCIFPPASASCRFLNEAICNFS